MRKLTLAAAMAAFLAVVAYSYAEVQHVSLSGELRIRGYWSENMYDLGYPNGTSDSDLFVAQRTRITVQADLDDKVLLVATLQASGIWGYQGYGEYNGVSTYVSGLQTGQKSGGNVSNSVELVEAYVQFGELFWSPLTLRLGRQGLNYGSGLILSNNEKEYRFDAARFVVDQSDRGFTVDLVAAKLADRAYGYGPFGSNPHRDSDLWFVNARYEPGKDMQFLKALEVYGGYATALYGGSNDAYVWLLGFRGDLALLKEKNLKGWFEFVWETGAAGGIYDNLNAWLFDVGVSYTFENAQYKPTGWVGYTLATGDTREEGGNRAFIPAYDYNVRGGVVLQPLLTNIEILGFGINSDPKQKWAAGLSGYWYRQNQKIQTQVGNPYIDNGGLRFWTTGDSRSLGFEINGNVTFNYSRDVKATLTFGWFEPGKAYDWPGYKADSVYEMRTEIIVNF